MICLKYQDTAEFCKGGSGNYANDRQVISEATVPVIFIQSTSFTHNNFQYATEADAVCYPDPDNDYIIDNHNRLEGLYVKCALYGVPESEAWYRVERVSVNRDHLLGNKIDNLECLLKKVRPVEITS